MIDLCALIALLVMHGYQAPYRDRCRRTLTAAATSRLS
jgi:hypothetical protein